MGKDEASQVFYDQFLLYLHLIQLFKYFTWS